MAEMTARCGTNDLNTDKGEVGGSSPPRPTIKIISKYAAILTFPLSGNVSQKTNLPTICQLYDWPDGTYTQGVKTLRVKAERLASIRPCRERCPVTRKAGKPQKDGVGRGSRRIVVLRGRSSVG